MKFIISVNSSLGFRISEELPNSLTITDILQDTAIYTYNDAYSSQNVYRWGNINGNTYWLYAKCEDKTFKLTTINDPNYYHGGTNNYYYGISALALYSIAFDYNKEILRDDSYDTNKFIDKLIITKMYNCPFTWSTQAGTLTSASNNKILFTDIKNGVPEEVTSTCTLKGSLYDISGGGGVKFEYIGNVSFSDYSWELNNTKVDNTSITINTVTGSNNYLYNSLKIVDRQTYHNVTVNNETNGITDSGSTVTIGNTQVQIGVPTQFQDGTYTLNISIPQANQEKVIISAILIDGVNNNFQNGGSFTLNNDDITITLVYKYKISVISNNDNIGTVSIGNGERTWTAETKGTSVILNATPSGINEFIEWNHGNSTWQNAQQTITLNSISDAGVYTANFRSQSQPTQYSITFAVNPSGGGTISGASVGTTTYNENTQISVTATATVDYTFDHWEENNNTYSTPTITITVTGDATYTAVFSQTYTLEFGVNPEGSGTITDGNNNPIGTQVSCNSGQSISVTAIAATGYTFDHWEEKIGNNSPTNISSLTQITIAPNSDARYIAVFDVITITTYELRVTIENQSGGTVYLDANNIINNEYQIEEGSHEINIETTNYWTVDYVKFNGETLQELHRQYVFNLITDSTLDIRFTRTYTVSATAESGGSCSITVNNEPSGNPATVNIGDNVTITAAPSPNYQFSHWNDDITDDNAVKQISNINSDETLYAHFNEITANVTVIVNDETLGSASASVNGLSCTLEAEPLVGYSKFIGFYEDADYSNQIIGNTVTISGNDNVTYYAKFEKCKLCILYAYSLNALYQEVEGVNVEECAIVENASKDQNNEPSSNQETDLHSYYTPNDSDVYVTFNLPALKQIGYMIGTSESALTNYNSYDQIHVEFSHEDIFLKGRFEKYTLSNSIEKTAILTITYKSHIKKLMIPYKVKVYE